MLDTNGATPSKFGNFYELWAISGAVLGGCSLRGGEGSIAGVICGAALVQITTTAVFFLGVSDTHKFTIQGEVLRLLSRRQVGNVLLLIVVVGLGFLILAAATTV